MNWSERIKSYRKNRAMPQKQLAHLLDVDVTTISRWERGITEPNQYHIGRFRDLVMLGKSPAHHPLVAQIAQLEGSLALIDMIEEKYLLTKDTLNLTGLGDINLVGRHPMSNATDFAHRSFEDVGGFQGMLHRGMLGYQIVSKRYHGAPKALLCTTASIVRMEGYNPILLLNRQLATEVDGESLRLITEDAILD